MCHNPLYHNRDYNSTQLSQDYKSLQSDYCDYFSHIFDYFDEVITA